MSSHQRACRISASIAVIVLLGCFGPRVVTSASTGDEGLFRALDGTEAVDRKALARLFFGAAATLEGGKTSVRLLQSVVSGGESSQQAIRDMMSSRFHNYDRASARFQSAVSRLLDRPASDVYLYSTLNAGHYVCLQLDGFTRLAETYGASTRDMLSVLSSMEGCELFRRAAFHPRVGALIEEALAGGADGAELRELREELRAMEELLEDLHEIDRGE